MIATQHIRLASRRKHNFAIHQICDENPFDNCRRTNEPTSYSNRRRLIRWVLGEDVSLSGLGKMRSFCTNRSSLSLASGKRMHDVVDVVSFTNGLILLWHRTLGIQ